MRDVWSGSDPHLSFGFTPIISGCVKHAAADVAQVCWMARG